MKDKKILIVGSTYGLGFETAKQFYKKGAQIWICGRNKDTAQEASQKLGNCNYSVADVSKEIDRKRLYEEVISSWQETDTLVLNVGSGKSKNGFEFDHEELKRVVDLNLFTHIELVQLFKSKIKESVISVSSIVADAVLSAPIPYSISKAALNHFVRCASSELYEKYKIRYNAVAPGNVLIAGNSWDQKLKSEKEKTLDYIEKSTSMNRFAHPEEIANVIVFLSSNGSQYINGQVIKVDGGSPKLKY